MRWLMLLVAVAGFAFAFVVKTPAQLGLCLVVGIVALVAAFLGFAAARIAATARPDAALLTDRDINTLRSAIRANKAAPPKPPVPPAQ